VILLSPRHTAERQRTLSILGHTHYHEDTKTLFSVTQCETCGQTIQGPNAVRATFKPNQLKELIRRGQLTYAYGDTLPPEGWYDEETGKEVCEHPDCGRTS